MDITEDISPLTEFKRESARMIARIKETGRPQILTVNGKPSVVVMDAAAWQDMQDQLDYAETVAGIRKGLTQARAGEGIEAARFFDGVNAVLIFPRSAGVRVPSSAGQATWAA